MMMMMMLMNWLWQHPWQEAPFITFLSSVILVSMTDVCVAVHNIKKQVINTAVWSQYICNTALCTVGWPLNTQRNPIPVISISEMVVTTFEVRSHFYCSLMSCDMMHGSRGQCNYHSHRRLQINGHCPSIGPALPAGRRPWLQSSRIMQTMLIHRQISTVLLVLTN